MPYGKTLEMKSVEREGPIVEREKRPRNRSLRGKARRRASRNKVVSEPTLNETLAELTNHKRPQ